MRRQCLTGPRIVAAITQSDCGVAVGYCEGLLLHCSHLVMRPTSCTPLSDSATARNVYVSFPQCVHSPNVMLPGDSSKRAILSIARPV